MKLVASSERAESYAYESIRHRVKNWLPSSVAIRCYQQIREQLAKVIVGQEEVIEQVLVTMFARGHALLEGVPGLAKTLLVSSLAALDLTFKRIQFTPDLMPSDVTGTEMIQEDPHTGERGTVSCRARFLPISCLADEINRTPPKTQAAMLEAMQERQVSVGGQVHRVPDSLHRTGHAKSVGAGRHLPAPRGAAGPVSAAHPRRLPAAVLKNGKSRAASRQDDGVGNRRRIGAERDPGDAATGASACRSATRCWDTPGRWCEPRGPAPRRRPILSNQWVSWGAGPRGLLTLVNCAKARALLHGRHHATVGRHPGTWPVRHCGIALRATTPLKPITSPASNWSTCCWRRYRRTAVTRSREDVQMSILSRYLDPEVLGQIAQRPFDPHDLVWGNLAGAHPSQQAGFAVEFQGHREYVPGDDPRHIDWRVFYRREKYFVKQYELETNFVCHLLLDVSASMRYGTRRATETACSRAKAAAMLAYCIVRQNDKVSLATFDNQVRGLCSTEQCSAADDQDVRASRADRGRGGDGHCALCSGPGRSLRTARSCRDSERLLWGPGRAGSGDPAAPIRAARGRAFTGAGP